MLRVSTSTVVFPAGVSFTIILSSLQCRLGHFNLICCFTGHSLIQIGLVDWLEIPPNEWLVRNHSSKLIGHVVVRIARCRAALHSRPPHSFCMITHLRCMLCGLYYKCCNSCWGSFSLLLMVQVNYPQIDVEVKKPLESGLRTNYGSKLIQHVVVETAQCQVTLHSPPVSFCISSVITLLRCMVCGFYYKCCNSCWDSFSLLLTVQVNYLQMCGSEETTRKLRNHEWLVRNCSSKLIWHVVVRTASCQVTLHSPLPHSFYISLMWYPT